MESDFFASILEQLGPLTGEICLHVLGEPLGHPQFPVFPALCARAGMSVNLTTNATLLPLHRQNILDAPALRQINFSLHSLLQGKKPDFSILEHVLAFCTEAMEKRPDLYVNLRLWNLDSLAFPRESALSRRRGRSKSRRSNNCCKRKKHREYEISSCVKFFISILTLSPLDNLDLIAYSDRKSVV